MSSDLVHMIRAIQLDLDSKISISRQTQNEISELDSKISRNELVLQTVRENISELYIQKIVSLNEWRSLIAAVKNTNLRIEEFNRQKTIASSFLKNNEASIAQSRERLKKMYDSIKEDNTKILEFRRE